MSQDHSPVLPEKVEAIYSLREAAEAKVLAELKADAERTPAARDALLDAQIELESKTQDALQACHECGHAHGAGEAHYSNNLLEFKKPD